MSYLTMLGCFSSFSSEISRIAVLGTPSVSLWQRWAVWHPVPQWDPTAHQGPVSLLPSIVPHRLPRGRSLTLRSPSLGWSRVWGGLGLGRGKWSCGEGEGGGDLGSASSGAELVWEHLRAHLEKQQWFKCQSLAFQRWGEDESSLPLRQPPPLS